MERIRLQIYGHSEALQRAGRRKVGYENCWKVHFRQNADRHA